jgi:hypothetical protein
MLIERLEWANITWKYVLVSQEQHQNGVPHFHALVQADKKIDTTNCNIFNLDGRHGNYQSCGNVSRTIQYIKKDGDWTESGQTSSGGEQWDIAAAAQSMAEMEFFQACVNHKVPYAYAQKFWTAASKSGNTIRPDDVIEGNIQQEVTNTLTSNPDPNTNPNLLGHFTIGTIRKR